MSNRGPAPVFFEIGFPLIDPGNYSYSESTHVQYIQIDQETKEKLAKWYGILGDKDLSKVRTPLNRLQYAIFERRNPEDAIVDAIIAWEGMFSEAFETTFKVTSSMAKFLRSGEDRRKLFERLKKLYQLRSDLVHGKESKSSKKENMENVRAEVIDIGLECLTKIIDDDFLLSIDSSERIKEILLYNYRKRSRRLRKSRISGNKTAKKI
jgi:Apea-like HEPN